MSEIRLDPITNKKVIVAPKRHKRPSDFQKEMSCPFCEGGEVEKNGVILYEICNEKGWCLRGIENKFPIVEKTQAFIKEDGHWSNYGIHEILIETREHDKNYFEMREEDFKKIFEVYKKRYRVLGKDDEINYVAIFKNHGKNAGASLVHPHSHIIALPFIPCNILEELNGCENYYTKNQKCVFCDIIDEVIETKRLKVFENDSILAYVPFAGIQPYELIILPKKHESHFYNITDEELEDLTKAVNWSFKRIKNILGDVDFNLMVYTGPINEGHMDHFHWHLKITVRLSYLSGQESDAMIRMRTTYPEDIAKSIREADQ